VMDICRQVMPDPVDVVPGHWARCHLFGPQTVEEALR
jgi:hypothetical protein